MDVKDERSESGRDGCPYKAPRTVFRRGLRILADRGYGELKLVPLRERLSVSTGAFYHSFDNWKDYTSSLLEHWQLERTTRLIELAEANHDPLKKLETLAAITIKLPHRAEAAIRAWNSSDPEVASVQKSVDEQRYSVIQLAFIELLGVAPLAEHYARAAMYLLIGFEQTETLQHEELLGTCFG